MHLEDKDSQNLDLMGHLSEVEFVLECRRLTYEPCSEHTSSCNRSLQPKVEAVRTWNWAPYVGFAHTGMLIAKGRPEWDGLSDVTW